MSTKNSFILLMMSLFLVLSTGLIFGQQPETSNRTTIKKIIQLHATGVELTDSGIAKLFATVKTNGKLTVQTFQVVGLSLIDNATYTLVVDGHLIATEDTSKDTDHFVDFEYSSRVQAGPEDGISAMPKTMRPVTSIKHIEIQDAQGRAVLTGDF